MDERITKLTTSQVKCFKTCRRRYKLEYIELLKPVETPKALEIGTLYHAGLEMLLKGMNIIDVECEVVEMAMHDAEKRGLDFEPLNSYVAAEMVKHWHNQSGYQKWALQAVEQRFEVSTGYAKRLIGKIDGLIRSKEDGKLYLIEHKTTSQWGIDGTAYLNNLLWDEQAGNYLYAYNRMLEDGLIDGEAVAGVFYDIIEKPGLKPFEKTPPEKRKYTKDGRLYAGQHEEAETPDEFRLRVREWYNAENRVHTTFVYRTAEQIKERIEDFNMALRDLNAAEREGTWYRNPESCKILPCPYRAKCLEDTPDTDCLFIKKQAQNEEL